MADPNESHRDDRSPRPDATPDVVDAELVPEPPRTPPVNAPAPDDEQTRQYEEYQRFREFQKFQEWQRQQDGTGAQGAPPPQPAATQPTSPQPPQGRPWWKKALGLLWSLLRPLLGRLLFLLITVVLVVALLFWLLSKLLGGVTGGGGGGGGTGGTPPGAAPVTPPSPQRVVRAFYGYIAHQPEQACALFTPEGGSAFAYYSQTPDCAAAAAKAHEQVTEPSSFSSPRFTNDVIEESDTGAVVDSCALSVSGGPPLGKFSMSRQPNGGWQIDNYQPAACS
ncbi:hypothetical protein ABZ805_00855 [Saccharopolyspora sp. NPDC047091]|uniref:hypothetical protein n=1 Tax=Saccharopolyspora sp. NPDC047091 TaxID=3155924 RepID=UPI0033F0D878